MTTRDDLARLIPLVRVDRVARVARVGTRVFELLHAAATAAGPAYHPATSPAITRVAVVPDETYPPDGWRIFDQHGREMSAGAIATAPG